MGFIKLQTKVKNGKKYHYFYYRVSRRSRIKDGGDGQPKTIDKLIGNYLNGQYLPFHLWDGLNPVDYAEAMIVFELKNYRLYDYIQWEVNWKFRKGKPTAGKLTFRAKSKSVDARASVVRKIRQRLQSSIDWMLQETANAVTTGIEAIAYHLACYDRSKASLAKAESQYKEWKQDPKKEWREGNETYKWVDLAGDIIQSNMETSRYLVDYHLSEQQSILAELLTYCPPAERKRFEAAIVRQSEKLSSIPNFIDRYEST